MKILFSFAKNIEWRKLFGTHLMRAQWASIWLFSKYRSVFILFCFTEEVVCILEVVLMSEVLFIGMSEGGSTISIIILFLLSFLLYFSLLSSFYRLYSFFISSKVFKAVALKPECGNDYPCSKSLAGRATNSTNQKPINRNINWTVITRCGASPCMHNFFFFQDLRVTWCEFLARATSLCNPFCTCLCVPLHVCVPV